MAREEQTDWLCRLRANLNNGVIFTPWNKEFTEALTGILDQETTAVQFAKWVATEKFDDQPPHNRDFSRVRLHDMKEVEQTALAMVGQER